MSANTANTDRYKGIKTKENYDKLKATGMFWEYHPELTGDWEVDKLVINGSDDDSNDCGGHDLPHITKKT